MKEDRFTFLRRATHTRSVPAPPPRTSARGTPTIHDPKTTDRNMVGARGLPPWLAPALDASAPDTSARDTDPIRNRPGVLILLLISVFVLELLYLILFALAPVPALHLSTTPLAIAWSWLLTPSRLLFPGAWGSALNQSGPSILLLGGTLVLLAAVYAFAVGQARRISNQKALASSWLLLPLAGAAVFGVTLLFQPTLFSNDVFNYIFSGRLLAVYHADPMNTAPIQFANDHYLAWIAQPDVPTFYGPLSLSIASLLASIGSGPVGTLFLFKAVEFLSHLLNTVLVWSILTTVAPHRRLAGTLLYAWNPLVLIELAGSGHNEGVFLTLLLLATWLHVQDRGRWFELGALLLFGLASSMNSMALLAAPLYIWFIVRTQRNVRRAIWSFCWRIVIVLAIMLSMYLPFWRGASTFLAITSAADMEHYVHSPLGVLAYPLRWIFNFVAQSAHFPPVMQPTTSADVTLRASTIFLFALIYFGLFAKVRHATTSIAGMRYSANADTEMQLPGFDTLLTSWSVAILGYMVLVSGWFWPWYLLWVLWAVTLRRFDTFTTSVFLLSSTALLTYPLLNFAASPLAAYQPLLIFGIPLVYWISRKKSRSERNKHFDD
jgi:hypothetical protein